MRRSRIIAVCGGRDYTDTATLYRILDGELETDGVAVLVHGGCRSGADFLANEWALSRKVSRRVFPADWAAHGRAAGPIRNRLMMTEAQPTVLLAFPGGKGTEDCIRAAEYFEIPVLRVGTPSKHAQKGDE